MLSKRLVLLGGILFASILLVALVEGCSDTEQAFGPTELVQKATLDLKDEVGEIKSVEEAIIVVAIPKAAEVKEIYDPWIANAIFSMLPDATLARLAVKGSVYVNDMELARAIIAMSGLETFDLSDEILLASWGCIRNCFGDPPGCTPCPQCCDKKEKGLYFELMPEF